MNKAQTRASVLVVLGAALCPSCQILGPGYIGPIQPPLREVPSPVTDLRAIEYGDQIIAGFSVPLLSTEGKPLKTIKSLDLYAGPAAGATDPNTWSKTATHYSVPASGPAAFEQPIPAQPWVGKQVVLYVRSTGPKGRLSAWSLPLVFDVAAPMARPANVMAESRKDGVRLTWQGSGPKYRVLRSTGTEMPQPIADVDKPEYLDESVQFGMTYQYLVLAFTDDKHQSTVSASLPKPIDHIDIFPPDVPTGLTATAGINAIELEWELNTEIDFKGYNVFRSVDNGPFAKVASLIPAATYHDTDVQTGKTYRYQVSAIDMSNNESQRSTIAQAALP